jgi:hypothetical protein
MQNSDFIDMNGSFQEVGESQNLGTPTPHTVLLHGGTVLFYGHAVLLRRNRFARKLSYLVEKATLGLAQAIDRLRSHSLKTCSPSAVPSPHTPLCQLLTALEGDL